MRSRIFTCLSAAAVFAACGGSDQPAHDEPHSVAPPVTGAAGGSASAAPMTASTPRPTPTTASQPMPAAPTTASQPMPGPGANPPAAMPQPGPAAQPTGMPPAGGSNTMGGAGAPRMLAMDECGLKTQYPGDTHCINPPPADKGFQMHVGPSNYDSPEARFVLQPGEEITESIPATAGNTTEVFYYWRQYRMRPGSHHLIINQGARRLGGTSNAVKDNPEAGIIAPENKGVGMRLPARAQLSNSLHYYNFTEKPIVKDVWVNFWYRDASEVTQPTNEVFSMLGMGIAPGQHVNKRGTCNITAPGRILTIYGHVHANNKRFSVWKISGSEKTLIHEAFDWEHPNISEFSTTVTNPTLDSAMKKDGGVSGMVELKAGDRVEFECEIVNNTNKIFLGANEAEDDEMCILIGDTIGTQIPAFGCQDQTLPVQ